MIDKRKKLLDKLKWSNDLSPRPNLVKAFPCDFFTGVNDNMGLLLPMMANIYINDILATAACQENMMRLLAAVFEAIFTICRTPDTAVQQYPLSLEKGHELIIRPRQKVLGLVIDTNMMTVGIADKFINKYEFSSVTETRTRGSLRLTTC